MLACKAPAGVDMLKHRSAGKLIHGVLKKVLFAMLTVSLAPTLQGCGEEQCDSYPTQ
jgi:hypothetical protein